MASESDRDRPAPAPVSSTPTAQELKGAIDRGRTGKRVAFGDLGAAPLGTDDEAAGTPDTADRVAIAMRHELKQGRSPTRSRPLSPNIQIYRPQLTSVLSILNRVTGVLLAVCAVVLVVWLIAAASGPQVYGIAQSANRVVDRTNRVIRGHLRFFPAPLRRHPASGLGHRAWI